MKALAAGIYCNIYWRQQSLQVIQYWAKEHYVIMLSLNYTMWANRFSPLHARKCGPLCRHYKVSAKNANSLCLPGIPPHPLKTWGWGYCINLLECRCYGMWGNASCIVLFSAIEKEIWYHFWVQDTTEGCKDGHNPPLIIACQWWCAIKLVLAQL